MIRIWKGDAHLSHMEVLIPKNIFANILDHDRDQTCMPIG
jgi:hypothetical protein